MSPDIPLFYPKKWEEEYKKHGYVSQWITEYPALFKEYLGWFREPGSLSSKLGTLDVFGQYALMYLLKRDQGLHSVTWFCLGCRNPNHKNWRKIQHFWHIMRQKMGADKFEALFTEIDRNIRAKVSDPFAGEPDLFCWEPKGTLWFFAEAKRGTEPLTRHQPLWFEICEKVTGQRVRIYRLSPES